MAYSSPLPAHGGERSVERHAARHDDKSGDIIRILLAIFLPPLGVFAQVGLSMHFWLNILLTLLGYVPGIIHAVWIILKR